MTNMTKVAADYPLSRCDHMGVHIELHTVKQGKYNSKPATLLIFEVSLDPLGYMPETCVEIRLAPLSGKGTKASTPYIGAFGPANILEWPYPLGGPTEYAQDVPASIEMHPSAHGALLIVRPRESNPKVRPAVFNFGIVAVHMEPAQVRVIPSTTDARRLRAFKRTAVNPINLDLDDRLGEPIVSCAQQGQDGCHSTCDDFGSAHMTPAIWAKILATFSLKTYDGCSANTSWAIYV